MRIIIAGEGEVGKDAVAQSIQKQLGVSHQSSSFAVKDKVFESSKYLQFKYQSPMEAWENRRLDRKEWYLRICEITAIDKSAVARMIFEESDIYVGMRNHQELKATVACGLCDLSVWIRSDIWGSGESEESNTITPEMCDIEFSNNCKTLEELDAKVLRVFSKIIPRINQKRPMVYVAGPYSNGDTEAHVQRAIQEWNILRDAGLTPFVPHLTHWVEKQQKRPYEFWMDYCFDVLPRCDALLRLPGMSPGSDREVARMRELGKPTFTDRNDLINYFRNRSK
jgi:hypothetical protein